MSKWNNPPPVVILAGSEEFLRTREVREALKAADATGRSIEYLRGEDHEGISRALSSVGVFIPGNLLLVVEEPEDVPVETILEHHLSGDDSVCILLHQEGAIKAKSNLGKVAAELPKKLVASFDKPKPWKEEEHALDFIAHEAARLKIQLSVPLAKVLLQQVGTDLGMLSFEIRKLAWLLASEKKEEVAAEHLRGTLAAFSEFGPKPLVEALEMRDHRAASLAFANMRRTHSGQLSGAVMRACAFVGRSATTWLHAASLLKKGQSAEEVATTLGQSSFVVSRSIVPAARRWGEAKLLTLIRSVARAERAVKSGHISAWVEFESALLHSLE